MKTKTKVGLILSLSLVVVGAGLAAVSLSSTGWSMENLFSDNRQLRVVGVDEPYSSVVVVTAVDGVKLDYSADNKESTVEVYYSDEYDYDIHVSEGTLYVTVTDDNRNISIDRAIRNGFSAHEVVLHLTGGEYSIVNLKTGLGNIDMEGDPFISKLYVETGIGDVDISKEAKIKDLDIKSDRIVLDSYAEVLKIGQTYRVKVKALPEGYREEDLIYTSPKEEIAKTQKGEIIAIAPGSVRIEIKRSAGP